MSVDATGLNTYFWASEIEKRFGEKFAYPIPDYNNTDDLEDFIILFRSKEETTKGKCFYCGIQN